MFRAFFLHRQSTTFQSPRITAKTLPWLTTMAMVPHPISVGCYSSNTCLYLNSSIFHSTPISRYLIPTFQRRKLRRREECMVRCAWSHGETEWPWLGFIPANLKSAVSHSCHHNDSSSSLDRASLLCFLPFILPWWGGTSKKPERNPSCM